MDHTELVTRSKMNIRRRGWERTITVDWADGTFGDITLDRRIWRAIIPIAFPDARSDVATLIGDTIDWTETRINPIPVCEQTLSLWRLATIVRHLDAAGATRVARGWMRLSLAERAWQQYDRSSPRIIHAQLLALSEGPSPVLSADIHTHLPRLIENSYSPTNYFWPRLIWVRASTRLGSTCMAFTTDDIGDFAACLAISTCSVRYRPATGEFSTEWCALQDLIDYISKRAADPRVDDNDGLNFSAHDFMEIASYLYDLHKRADPRPWPRSLTDSGLPSRTRTNVPGGQPRITPANGATI